MIIQKLRLQRGWSQQQLAEMSGLSTRTIQRIENGQKPSMESVKSLAAVFDVDFLTLQKALQRTLAMNTEETKNTQASINPSATQKMPTLQDLQLTETEQNAYKHVKKIKRFYRSLVVFVAVMLLLFGINALTSPHYWWVVWVLLGWGGSFIIRAFFLFGIPNPIFSPEWEQRQIDKYLKQKS